MGFKEKLEELRRKTNAEILANAQSPQPPAESCEAPRPLPETLPVGTEARSTTGGNWIAKTEAKLVGSAKHPEYLATWSRDGRDYPKTSNRADDIDWSCVAALPTLAQAGEPSAGWLEGARWICEQLPEIEAVAFIRENDWHPIIEGTVRRPYDAYVSSRLAKNIRGILGGKVPLKPEPTDARRFTRSELLASQSESKAQPEPFTIGALVYVAKSELAAAAGSILRFEGSDGAGCWVCAKLDPGPWAADRYHLRKSTTQLVAPPHSTPDPDSLAARFPMSHGERCGFCEDLLGSHEVVQLLPGPPLHAHCAEQLSRRRPECPRCNKPALDILADRCESCGFTGKDARRREALTKLPTCLCGATIFRAFKVPLGHDGETRTGCAECYVKATGPVASEPARAALDREGGHPWDAWSTPTYDGEG